MKYILTILCVVSFQMLHAQDTILTLQQCRQQALEYNKTLKTADYQKSEALAYQKAARTAYLPTLSASGSIMHDPKSFDINMPGGFLPTANSLEEAQAGNFSGQSNVYSPGMSLSLNNLTYINAGISLTQPIYAGGKIRYSNKKADAGVKMSTYAYSLKYSEVIENTDKAFWQVASIQAGVELAESYIKMLSELSEQMDKMYELGLIQASEKLKVNVQKNEADLQLLKAKNGLKIAKMYLNQVLGKDLSNEINISYLDDEVQLLSVNQGVESALNNRNELKILQEQLKMAEYDKKITMADYLPSAGVSFQYSTMYVNELYDDWEFQPMIAGQVSIPLFSWGQGRQKQKAAEMQILQKQEQLSNTNDLISLEVMQVKVKIEEAYETISIAKKNIAEAKESLDETKASFKAGLNTTTDLLKAQSDWKDANTQLINAKANYRLLQTQWQKVTGNLQIKND